MESLKEKLPFILAIIVAIAICGVAFYFWENCDDIYYTQIDNTKIERISSSDNMKYEYTLDCFDENGKKKEIKFKTSRELREDAYLMLEVRSLGVVHSWKEVQENELPEKVKTNYHQ